MNILTTAIVVIASSAAVAKHRHDHDEDEDLGKHRDCKEPLVDRGSQLRSVSSFSSPLLHATNKDSGQRLWRISLACQTLADRRREVRRSFKLIATTRVAGQTRCFGGSLVLSKNWGSWPSLASVVVPGLAACSTSVKLPSLGGPTPDQPQEMDCAALNAERTRLLAQRDDLE